MGNKADDGSTASDNNFKTPSPTLPKAPWYQEGWVKPLGVSISAILISSFLIWGGVTLSGLPHSLARLETAIETNNDSLDTKIDTKIDSQQQLLEEKIVAQRQLLEQKVDSTRDVLDVKIDHLDDKMDNQSALLNRSISGIEKQLEAIRNDMDNRITAQRGIKSSDDFYDPDFEQSLTHAP